MRIIPDVIDNAFYFDLVISEDEFTRLEKGEMLQATALLKNRKYHVGIFVDGKYDFINDDNYPEGE